MMRYVILGLLRHNGPRHGYALLKEVRARIGLNLSIGNVYRELAHLLTDGLLASTANPVGADPRRAPYEITPAGIATFDSWLSAAPTKALVHHHDEFCARAFFLGQADPSVGRKIIERWKDELAIHGKTLERAKEAATAPNRGCNGSPIDVLPFFLSRWLRHVAVDLEFIEQLRVAHERWVETGHGSPEQTRPRRPPLRAKDDQHLRRARPVAH
jgi:DNA-binding PadR family transcriptional regulator